MLKMFIIKTWLKIKLKQISTTGGLAVLAVWIFKQLGYEIPNEYLPQIENIGMAVAGIGLILLKESGEADKITEVKNEYKASIDINTASNIVRMQSDPSVQNKSSNKSPEKPPGGFNG